MALLDERCGFGRDGVSHQHEESVDLDSRQMGLPRAVKAQSSHLPCRP